MFHATYSQPGEVLVLWEQYHTGTIRFGWGTAHQNFQNCASRRRAFVAEVFGAIERYGASV